MNKILCDIKKDIKENILPVYPFIKDYKIEKIYKRSSCLAYYRHNSITDNKGIPIIRLNIPVIYREAEKEKLSLHDILLTTIIHELGHAIQNYKGSMGYYDEEEAEDFAYWYWDFGYVCDDVGERK